MTWVVETWYADYEDHAECVFGPYEREGDAWRALQQAGWTVTYCEARPAEDVRLHAWQKPMIRPARPAFTTASPPPKWNPPASDSGYMDWTASVYELDLLPPASEGDKT